MKKSEQWPTRLQCLNGSQLKLIAVICMLIDHIGLVFVGFGILERISADAAQFPMWCTIYHLLRMVGRVTFPIMAFLVAEGYLHSRNWKKYVFRLLFAAFISEIPFDLMVSDQALCLSLQNVMFTLAVGLMAVRTADGAERYLAKTRGLCPELAFVPFAAGAFVSLAAAVVRSDYGCLGSLMILIFYSLRGSRLRQCLAGLIWLAAMNGSWPEIIGLVLAFLLIWCYDGSRGKSRLGYGWYTVYPLHMLLFWFIGKVVM